MTEIYSVGTIAVTEGSVDFVGTGTGWLPPNAKAGDQLNVAGMMMGIAEITDATHGKFAVPYPGADGAGLPYAIFKTSSEWGTNRSLSMSTAEMIQLLATLEVPNTGLRFDALGNFAGRSNYDDRPTAFGYLSLNGDGVGGTEPVVFAKLSGSDADWSPPILFRGGVGLTGPSGILVNWRHAWVTATAYALKDGVQFGGSSYICLIAHTAGDFATDLAAGRWELTSAKGSPGNDGVLSANEEIVTAASRTITAADNGKIFIANRAAGVTFNFDPVATLGTKWLAMFKNVGAGPLTIDPDGAETIDGVATLALATGESAMVSANGGLLRSYFRGSSAFTPASSAGPAQLDLAEDTDNGTSKVSLKAPASLAANRAFILPDADVTLTAFIASLLNSTTLTGAQSAIGVRTVLAADQVFYVGYNMGAVSISIATPGVVTKVAHGLVANDRVSFSILPNHKAATISIATPAVVTMANSFAAGQPIKFSSSGRLPTGVTAGATYYVIAAGLSGASFQFSATVGGAAINTSAPAVTISNASPGVVTLNAHGLAVGDPVMFATTGALPAGITAGVVYFVKTVPNANTFTVSATPEGAAINTSSAGAGTHTLVQHGSHLLAETGTLPTGVTEGQDYYVLAAGLTADTFRFSATSGGAPTNTTGAATGTISMKTGSDSHDGKANTAAGAFLTLQKAMDVISDTLDLGSFNAAVVIADGTYLGGVALRAYVGRGAVTFLGNAAYPGNSALNTAGNCFNGYFCGGRWTIKDMELRAAGNGMNLDGPGNIQFSNLRFGPCSNAHVRGTQGAQLDAIGDYSVVGGGGFHLLTGWLATITVNSRAVTFYGAAFSVSTAYADSLSLIQLISTTFPGAATVTGKRYTIGVNAAINVAGSPAGEAYIPGSIAGSKGPGGQYN